MFLGVGQFRPGAGTGDQIVGLFRHRTGDLGPQALGAGLGLVAGEPLQGAGEDHGLAGHGAFGAGTFDLQDVSSGRQVGDSVSIAQLMEEVDQGQGRDLAHALDAGQLQEASPGALSRRRRGGFGEGGP